MEFAVKRYRPDGRAKSLARLIFRTEPEVFLSIYGSEDRGVKVIRNLIAAGGNYFGAENIFVAESGDTIAGMLVGYAGREQKDFASKDPAVYRKAAGLAGNLAIFFRSRFGLMRFGTHRVPDDTYFISDISVLPDYRNRGIGSRLVENAVRDAVSKGCTRVVLDVYYPNAGAKRLYERLGFREYSRHTGLYRGRTNGFYHMEKLLPVK